MPPFLFPSWQTWMGKMFKWIIALMKSIWKFLVSASNFGKRGILSLQTIMLKFEISLILAISFCCNTLWTFVVCKFNFFPWNVFSYFFRTESIRLEKHCRISFVSIVELFKHYFILILFGYSPIKGLTHYKQC